MPETSELRDWIQTMNPEALLMTEEGYDPAIIGMASRCAMDPVVVYSVPKVIECMMGQGMSEEDAIEWFEFNTRGAYVGENGPIFLDIPDLLQ